MKHVEEYYNKTGHLSQSFLKVLPKGAIEIQKFLNQGEKHYDEQSENMLIGSAVDCLLTHPDGSFDKIYKLDEVKKPTAGAAYGLIVRELVEEFEDVDSIDEISDTVIEHYCQKYKTYVGKPEAMRNAGKEYFAGLASCRGYIMLSPDQLKKIEEIRNSMETHPHTSWVFDLAFDEDVETYNQYPVYFKYRGHLCKALLDRVYVFRKDKKIGEHTYKAGTILGVDFKALSVSFYSSAKKFRHDVQGAFYCRALDSVRSKLVEGDSYIHFVFVCGYHGKEPDFYFLQRKDMEIGEWGAIINNHKVKIARSIYPDDMMLQSETVLTGDKLFRFGYQQMITIYEKYTGQGQWEVNWDLYETHGRLNQTIW